MTFWPFAIIRKISWHIGFHIHIYEDIRIVQHVIIISFFDQNIVLSLKLKIHQVVSVQCAVLYYSGLYMHICVPDTTFVMTETT